MVLFLPATLVQEALTEAHGELLTGHKGVYKTKERLFQCFYWPGMDADIAAHLKSCHRCQVRRRDDRPPPTLLSPLPLPTEPGQRVHADLFGPLKTLEKGKKFILCITDAFTKYVELVALPNKEAATVAEAIIDKWICRFGAPLDLVTDQGTEFCARMSQELFTRLGTAHLTTTLHHPQCNSQAEVANKTIAKYLASFCDDSTLDWEMYLAPLMFSYNTSFHRSIKTSPFFLKYGMEPGLPTLPTPDLRRKFYGESSTDDLIRKLLLTRDIARRNSEVASDKAERQFNKKTEPHAFLPDQLVLLDEHSFLAKNQKLAAKWSGPHKILRLKGECNVELLLRHNNKKLIVHVNRLKPYFVLKSAAVESPNFFPAQKLAPPPPTAQQNVPEENFLPSHILNEEVTSADPYTYAEARRTPSPTPSVRSTHSQQSVQSQAPTYAQIVTQPRRARTSSSSSQSLMRAPPADAIASQTRSRTGSFTPERPKIYMPQISYDPLPVLNEGGDLEVNSDVAINIVDEHSSWTVVKKKRQNKKFWNTLKWNKQQKKNFEQFGDPWYQEPYKYYHAASHDTPVAGPVQPQQQLQQQPVLQPQPVVQPQPGLPPPQQPVVVPPQLPAGQLIQPAPVQPQPVAPVAVPRVVITPPPQERTPKIQKRRLPAIPEEDEATATRRPKVEVQSPPEIKPSPRSSTPQENVQLGRRRHQDFYRSRDEEFRGVFEQLDLTPEFELFEASPTSTDNEEAVFPPIKQEAQSPITPKPAPPLSQGS